MRVRLFEQVVLTLNQNQLNSMIWWWLLIKLTEEIFLFRTEGYVFTSVAVNKKSLKEFFWCNCISIFRFRFGFGGRIFWKAVVFLNFVICQCSLKIPSHKILLFSAKRFWKGRMARFHIFLYFYHCWKAFGPRSRIEVQLNLILQLWLNTRYWSCWNSIMFPYSWHI